MMVQILIRNVQERLRQQAIKEQEKERLMFYQKQKEGQKDVRSKYREKVFQTFLMLLLSGNLIRADIYLLKSPLKSLTTPRMGDCVRLSWMSRQ